MPGNFLGGARRLDLAAAEAAVAGLAARLGITPEACAAGIHDLVNARMADGVRLATVRRGVDPRDCALLAFGGAAGLHATAVARELGLQRAAVPLFAAGLSAWGMLHTDLRYEMTRSAVTPGGMPDRCRAARPVRRAGSRGPRPHGAWHGGETAARRSADMRYGEQVFEIAVPLDGIDWAGPDLGGQIRAAFHARHRALFTYALPEEEVVLVNARLAVVGVLPRHAAAGGRGPAVPAAGRRSGGSCWTATPVVAPVHRFDSPRAGPGIRRAGDRRERHHHRAAAPGRRGADGCARLAGDRGASGLKHTGERASLQARP